MSAVAALAAEPDAGVRHRFERALEETVAAGLTATGDSPLAEPVRWHFGIGCGPVRTGKRLRPRLLVAVALEEGGTFEAALDAALAVELLHNYSLVHDDIEDGDTLRHGRETVWARFGLAQGVNAGDALGALTHLALLRNRGGLPAERVTAMARVLHGAHLAMCVGQAYDLAFESARRVTMDEYLAMIDGKTAALFGAALELGALAAGAGEARAAAYGAVGRAYGRAFQIHDDIAGTWHASSATGKGVAGDLARRKWTFPVVWALGAPPSERAERIAERYRDPAPLQAADLHAIATSLEALGAREAAFDACRAQLRTAQARSAADGLDRGGRLCAVFGPELTAAAAAAR